MARYIDADELVQWSEKVDLTEDGGIDINVFDEYVQNAPTVEERKTGKWIQKEDPYGFFDTIPVCSECGHTTKMRETYNYCPNCGARMEDEP